MLGLPNEPLPGQLMRASDHAAMIRYVKSIAPRPGPGIRTAVGSGGQTRYPILRPASKQWPLGGAQTFPFQITWGPDPANPGQYLAKVNPDSTLMLSCKPNDNLAITGLGVSFPFIANDVIALYIVVSDYAAQSATIQSYGMGTTTFDPTLEAWGTGDNTYVFDDGATTPNQKQIGINILLGYSTPDSTGKPYFVQTQFTHMLLVNCVIDGYAAIYDFSPRERYGITAPAP